MPDSKPPPTSTASKRIKKEIADLAKENLGDISLTPDEANIFAWKAILPGPSGSPYEGGRFEVDIRIPSDYPFSPPKLHFITKVYHCNISHTGAICLDLLKSAWSPALSLYKVILSLSSLLTDPNPADPLVPAIAQEYRTQRKKHDSTAQEWVKLYAMPKVPAPPAVIQPKKAKKPDRLGPVPRFDASGNPVCPPAPFVRGRRPYSVEPPASRPAAGPSATIDLADDSDDEVDQSIEILGENPMSSNRAGGSSTGARAARDREPPRKKARGAREDSDEVIVVED